MDSVLELILTILTLPFGDKYDDLYSKINLKKNKFLRGFLKFLIIFIPLALIIGITSLASYLIRGYWI